MRQHVDAAAVVDLTRRLVQVDTRNPPGNERDAIGLCREALAPFDATFEEFEVEPGRTSLLARVGDGSRPALIVNGHLDVVPIDHAAWEHDPFAGEEHDGRLYGRGTTDMKGGIAAAVEALHVLLRAGREPACDVVFHLVADEERGGRLGTQALVEQGHVKGAAACLVPEPTSNAVCVAERGLYVATITTFGRPAHGSNPRAGVSAIETAAKVVLALHAGDFGDPPHPLLGKPTLNVGTIEGGSGHNTVAERCDIVVDRRVLPGTTAADVERQLRQRIDAIVDPDLRYEIVPDVFGEASEMDRDDAFAVAVQRSMASVTGKTPDIIGMSFTTDARFVRNQGGVPAVVCGPGDVSEAHTNDESLSIDLLVDASAAFAELYATFSPM